jgi:hypothetical protein
MMITAGLQRRTSLLNRAVRGTGQAGTLQDFLVSEDVCGVWSVGRLILLSAWVARAT